MLSGLSEGQSKKLTKKIRGGKVMKKMLKSKKGFSLIELLIVIAILAVLAAISINLFGGVLNNNKVKADKAACSYLQTAIQAYIAETDDSYLQGLVTSATTVSDSITTPPAGISVDTIIQRLSSKMALTVDGEAKSYGPYLNSSKAKLSQKGKYFKVEVNWETQVVRVTVAPSTASAHDLVQSATCAVDTTTT
jgi:prepilin-type N-terminal cleavage/methylation domain-containing protein